MKSERRNQRGSVLAEFGPALGILLIGFFFPMVNLIGLTTSYASCYTLNSAQVNEAALLQESKASGQAAALASKWSASGIGKFACLKGQPSTSVVHAGSPGMRTVIVRTSFQVNPWLAIPLPFKCPGANAPLSFRIESARPVESKTDRQ